MKHLIQEALGPFMARMAEEFFRRAFFDDKATVHEDDAVGHFTGEAHFVRDHNHGHAVFG